MTGINSNINLFTHNGKATLWVPHSGVRTYTADQSMVSGAQFILAKKGFADGPGVDEQPRVNYYDYRDNSSLYAEVYANNNNHGTYPSSVAGVLTKSIMHMDHNTFMDIPSTGYNFDQIYDKEFITILGYVPCTQYKLDTPLDLVPDQGLYVSLAVSGVPGVSVSFEKIRFYCSGNSEEYLYSYATDESFPRSTYKFEESGIQVISIFVDPMFYLGEQTRFMSTQTKENFVEQNRLGVYYPNLYYSVQVSGDPSYPAIKDGDVKFMALEMSTYSDNNANSGIPLWLCGSEKNVKCYDYEDVDFRITNRGEQVTPTTQYTIRTRNTFRFSTDVPFASHYKLNEGSGNIVYDITGTNSGIWQQSHVGEPHWFDGEAAQKGYDPMHISYYANYSQGVFGIDLNDVYQRSVRLGSAGSEDKKRTFKFSNSAPTGDFTIVMIVTHSGHDNGNLLEFIDSGNAIANDYADFRMYGGSGTYTFETYDTDGFSYGATATANASNAHINYGRIPVRPIIVASYKQTESSGYIALTVGADTTYNGEYEGSTYIPTNRRVLNSGDLYMPGINHIFGRFNCPAYYEELIIIDEYLDSTQRRDLTYQLRACEATLAKTREFMGTRSYHPWGGFDITNKGYLEFDIPNYSGEVVDGFRFKAPNWSLYDSGVLFNLSNNPNALKVNAFVKVETNNPSGIIFNIGSPASPFGDGIDWSGVPHILTSGEHYVEITGSFPNGNRTFGGITGTGLADFTDSHFEMRLSTVDIGNNYYTANTKIYGIDICYSGDYKPHSFDPAPTGLTLFTEGVLVESSGIDLFIEGHLNDSGYFDLFTEGSITLTGVMPLHTKAGQINTLNPSQQLFVYGHTDNNSSGTLFVQGHIVDSGYHTLFINGVFTDTNTMNLYIKGTPPADSSGNLPMYVLATSGVTSGFKTTPMFISSFSGPYPSGGMNLFLSSPETVTYSLTNTMNLFMKGLGDESGYQQNSNTINMFIQNDAIGDSGNFPLFINNQTSNSSGYVPVSGFMNLFINRQFESVSHNFPMFINGPSGDNSSVTLFMQAQPNDRSGISMYIDGIGASNNPIDLYTHGF